MFVSSWIEAEGRKWFVIGAVKNAIKRSSNSSAQKEKKNQQQITAFFQQVIPSAPEMGKREAGPPGWPHEQGMNCGAESDCSSAWCPAEQPWRRVLLPSCFW